MPLYAYVCPKCEHEFEALTRHDPAQQAVECPECGSDKPVRSLSLPARPVSTAAVPATNCRGDGPPCGASWCGRK